MKYRYAGWLLLLWAWSSFAMALTPVALKEGMNQLDLNRDGVMDYVMVAHFDNNTSHPNLGLTFYVSRAEGGLSIMPVTNSELFTWFDYRLSAASDFLVLDNKLFLEPQGYYLITARKRDENLFDPGKVELTAYRFTESRDDPGVPLYEWTKVKSAITKSDYQSADMAYDEADLRLLSE